MSMRALIVPSPLPDNMGAMHALAHGPFDVAPDGSLGLRRPPALRFAWRGRAVEAHLGDGRIAFSARAGALPSTAEPMADRRAAVATVAGLPAELPEGWRLLLSPDHRLRLEAELPIPGPTTATGLVSAMVRFALALDPYLDRLEFAGVGAGAGWPGSTAPGTAKT
jgi:hypothetical protein